MAYYLSSTSLLKRWMTENGFQQLLDQDGDGTVEDEELSLLATSALSYASNIIDSYICGQIEPATARGSGNEWLSDRCLDLAVYRVAGQGGKAVPQSVLDAMLLSKELLEGVRDGALIPGYTYPSPINSIYHTRRPIVSNP